MLGALAAMAVPGLLNLFGQREANEANQTMAREASQSNIQTAREQMAFQERMSNSAYQRSMEDMRQAGLNPMLAFQQGGASTPSGAAGQSIAGHVENALGPAVGSALEGRRLRKEIQAAESQQKLNDSMADAQRAQEKLSIASAKVANINAKKAEAELPAVRARSNYDIRRTEMDDKFLEWDAYQNRIGEAVGTIVNGRNIFKKNQPFFDGKQWDKQREIHVDRDTGEIIYDSRGTSYNRRKK